MFSTFIIVIFNNNFVVYDSCQMNVDEKYRHAQNKYDECVTALNAAQMVMN